MATGAAHRIRAPDQTRGKLLSAAFEEMFHRGFQAASLETILAKAGVTKGALYHHFPSKAALGMAVVDEVVREPVLQAYLGALESATDDPLTALQDVLRHRADAFRETGVDLGCPLNNLAQEMSPIDEDFRRHIASAMDTWVLGFARALDRAQAAGSLRGDVDTRRVARFLVAATEGAFGMAKNAQSVDDLRSNLEVLADFLDTLRA